MSKEFIITGTTKTICLIGHPVEHSFSPIMHNAAFKKLGLDYVYVAYEVHPDNLESAIKGMRALDIKGMNVTIPHKQEVMKYVDEIDPIAEKMGAINTIKNDNGVLKARNTDAGGARKSLIDAGCELSGKNVLILGSGGVSRALAFILAEDVGQIVLTDIVEDLAIGLAKEVSEKTGANIEAIISNDATLKEEAEKADILINATPLGMYPKMDASPIAKELLHKDLFVFDVIYNPLETKFMKEATEIGCKTLSGLDMLVNQGVLAFEWFTGKTPNSKLMKEKIVEFLGIK